MLGNYLGDDDRGCVGVRSGFDCTIRPEPEVASQTTPKHPIIPITPRNS